jgi:hypothetical protein
MMESHLPGSCHVGFVVDKVILGKVYFEYFGFPCQFSFHRLLHTHLSSAVATIDQIVADIPSGLTLTPLKERNKIGISLGAQIYKPDLPLTVVPF